MNAPANPLAKFLRKYLTEIVLIFGCILVFGFTALINDAYVSRFQYNVQHIIRYTSMLGIFAVGASIVIISGGIDLSSGSMIAFGGMTCCMTISILSRLVAPDSADPTADVPLWIIASAIMITMLVGLLVGTLHTWLITIVGLPPFVATLASLVGLRSLALIMTKAVTAWQGQQAFKINIQDEMFGFLGSQWWIPLVVFAVVAGTAWILMNKTVTGRHLYAMGGNEQAAKLSGIRTERLKWLAYCLGTSTAAIAGILFSSEVGSSDPQTQGIGYELFAIAAAVVGGCSLQGGVGRITGVVMGAMFLRVVIDAVAKIIGSGSSDYEGLIVGLLVVLAVAFNQLSGQRQGWKKQFFPGLLGWMTIPIISLAVGASVLTPEGSLGFGLTVAAITLAVLSFLKVGADMATTQGGKSHG
ncbi:MAG: ABC transporter permease [Planctomycetales bacterium]|nr:ABC transporter permease [Planctomycetales bacterium]